jgi:glycosyltransferase involved in cell wall biosynthesis
MKILLVGEYNRTHWNLKKGLETLGHQVVLIGNRDGFKKVNVDIEIKNPFASWFLKKIRILIVKVFGVDLLSVAIKRKIKSKKQQLSGYDIVQFVNESPFLIDRKSELKIFKWLSQWNSKIYLLSTGVDYPSVHYAYNKNFKYSILTPYFEGKISKKDFHHVLVYLSKDHKKLYEYVYKNIVGIIANDIDYHIPLVDDQKYLGIIPHAVDLSQLQYQTPIIDDKIIIFHGINSRNYFKKGNDIFEMALEVISDKYASKVEIITTKDLPYKTYIKYFDRAHILLDQIFAYDQGYNALEAMAKGKVVFTGAEQEWQDYYKVTPNTIAINALPDAHEIIKKLEWLIENPEKITEISKNARQFVETYHNHIDCAKQYIEKWS